MTTAVLEPPTTEAELRERAEGLAQELEDHLEPAENLRDQERDQRVAACEAFFSDLRAAIVAVARSPAWRAHDLARELLLLVEDLRDAMTADPDARDPEWRQREVLQRMLVVLHAMIRQLAHAAIDRPEQAAQFVAEALSDVEVGEVAVLLETSTRMIGNYRSGHVGQIRKNPNRVTLVGQLVYELRYSMTSRGILLWFDAPMELLGGRTPRDLLDEDPAANREMLITLARGGRAQLDLGGAAYADVEHAA